jgi:hypothetical protein
VSEKEKGFAREDAPLDLTAGSRIVVTFADDHNLDGAKVEVRDVSPEQIAVVLFYLTRVANALTTAREMEQARAKQSPLEIARSIPQKLRKD